MDERRQHPRFERKLSVRYVSGTRKQQRGLTADVSADGMFIHAPDPEAVGKVFGVEIDLPAVGSIRLIVQTVYVEGNTQRGGFGVRILNAPDEWCSYWKD